MSSKRVQFENSKGQLLAARVELPDKMAPHNFAIFAHCFTCSKNLSAVKAISRSLNNYGIGVLRFDFTGLGESEGAFEDTDFSSNIADLICASDFLTKEYMSPTILVGHSLGGAAVIFAAAQLNGIKAVATIGAPSSPAHVQNLFTHGRDEIEQQGSAQVSIGGRAFTVTKDFLDDIESKNMEKTVKSLRKPLLVIHSPQDTTVGIENAKEIYVAAHHPKSFVSIDGADHLLTKQKDAMYVGNLIAGWVERYLDIPEREEISTSHQVAVSVGNEGYTSEIIARKHLLIADEPESIGGNDFGPTPSELVSSGLGACTAITLRMYADRKSWDLQRCSSASRSVYTKH
jgi:esterase/lipase